MSANRKMSLKERIAKEEVESTFGRKVLAHWREFRPKMCADLEREGKLYQAVWAASTRTLDLLTDLTCGPQKMNLDRAQEIAYREWYLLPDEEDQPSLTFDPRQLQPVSPETSA